MSVTNPASAWPSRSRLRAQALAACALLWLAGPVAAEPLPASVKGRCAIEFSGTSTFHSFSGQARSLPFELVPQLDASSGRPRWSGSVEVAVAEMDTGIDRRDRKMREMFEADRFPQIVADFSDVQATALAAARDGGEFDLPFVLKIREIKRPITAKASHWIQQGPGAGFDVAFDLSLEEFDLEVPPVLGLLRVGDVVKLHVHVTLDQLPIALREPAASDPMPASPASHS
jgi:hypothetical protein